MPLTRSRRSTASKSSTLEIDAAPKVSVRAKKQPIARAKKSVAETNSVNIKDDIKNIQEERDKLRTENEMLLDNFNKISTELKEEKTNISDLKMNEKHLQQQLEHMHSENAMLKESFEGQKNTLKKYDDKFEQINSQLADKNSNLDKQFRDLRESLSSEQMENKNLKDKLETKESNIADLKAKQESQDIKLSMLESDVQSERDKVKLLESQNNSFISEWATQLSQMMQQHKENLEQSNSHNIPTNIFFDKMDQTSKEQIKQIFALQKDLNETKLSLSSANQEHEVLYAKIRDLEGSIHNLNEQNTKLIDENSELKQKTAEEVAIAVNQVVQQREKQIQLSHEEEIDEINQTMDNLKKRLLYEQQRNIEILSQLKRNDSQDIINDF